MNGFLWISLQTELTSIIPIWNEWASDCCLEPNWKINEEHKFHLDKKMTMSILY
jgi:hypothetical protein